VKEGEQEAVVSVARSLCESVTERDEFVGRLSFGSRFPQYLIETVSVATSHSGVRLSKGHVLDYCDVDWSGCGGSVDFTWISHSFCKLQLSMSKAIERCSFAQLLDMGNYKIFCSEFKWRRLEVQGFVEASGSVRLAVREMYAREYRFDFF